MSTGKGAIEVNKTMRWLAYPRWWQPLAVIGWRDTVGNGLMTIRGLTIGLSFLPPGWGVMVVLKTSRDKRLRHLCGLDVEFHRERQVTP